MTQHIAEAFHFCPQCCAENQETGSSPFRCKECGFVFYFSPVAAVGGLVVNSNNELLFLVRGCDPGKGKFGLPGGFVDPGEPLGKISHSGSDGRNVTSSNPRQVSLFVSQPIHLPGNNN